MDELEKQLRSLLASQAELVGSITHDIKGLISGIDGGIYLTESGLNKDKPERISQGFEMVKRNLARIKRTVSSVLYYVKDREIDWQPIEIDKMTHSVSKALLDQATHLGVRLSVNAGQGVFQGGEFAVHSLLVNLVTYAIETCSQNKLSSTPSVTLSATLADSQVIFDIIADGFCITEETSQLSMEQFYAPKGVDRSHLGLFIANKLASDHQGSLNISASPETGSTRFTVALPMEKPLNVLNETNNLQNNMFDDELNSNSH